MAHPTVVIAPSPLRRTLAGILRGGTLPHRERLVLHRLLVDPRTAMRLLVGAGVERFDETTASAASAHLATLGVVLDAGALVYAWRASLTWGDRWAPAGTLTKKVLDHNAGDDAAQLAATGLDQWTRGLIILCGGDIESVPRREAA